MTWTLVTDVPAEMSVVSLNRNFWRAITALRRVPTVTLHGTAFATVWLVDSDWRVIRVEESVSVDMRSASIELDPVVLARFTSGSPVLMWLNMQIAVGDTRAEAQVLRPYDDLQLEHLVVDEGLIGYVEGDDEVEERVARGWASALGAVARRD